LVWQARMTSLQSVGRAPSPSNADFTSEQHKPLERLTVKRAPPNRYTMTAEYPDSRLTRQPESDPLPEAEADEKARVGTGVLLTGTCGEAIFSIGHNHGAQAGPGPVFGRRRVFNLALTSKKLGWTRRRTIRKILLFSGEVRSAMDVER
jgi:hypothetical protein